LGVGQSGIACRSVDGGETWTTTNVGSDNVLGRLLWTGDAFTVWAPGTRFTSPDGLSWTATPTTPEGIWIGPAAFNPESGAYVATPRVWDGYEEQSLLRSDNGVDWETLDAGSFEPGHPIFELAFGYGEPSALCPG
ncbi:MAG: hypothetical protein AAF721_39415, partial [Myxococcota bacterium]